VELSQNVKLGPYVRTICLPEADEDLSTPGAVAHVAGWGKTSERDHRSTVLLHSAFQIQSNDLCDQTTEYYFNQSVTFCAGDGKGGNDTCHGDSGGSLVRRVLRKGSYRWVTVGLVSWGEECGERYKYGYYTRMEPFTDWIQTSTSSE
jgi:secreted trypsin-like serine protease